MYRQREGNLLVCIATSTTVCGCVKSTAQPPHVYLITCLVWTLATEIFLFPFPFNRIQEIAIANTS